MSAAMELTDVIRAMRASLEILELPSLQIQADNHGREVMQNLGDAIAALEEARRELLGYMAQNTILDPVERVQ